MKGGLMTLRALRTPLTLAVLSLLREQPRHPYEMQALVRERQVGEVVKLRGGSLYDAIGRLVKAGLIEAVDTGRSGARPERTVYAITEDGIATVEALTRDYLRAPAEEYPVFVTALAHIFNLGVTEAVELLRERRQRIREKHDEVATQLAALPEDIPRVVLLEVEYAQALRKAELAWLDEVVQCIDKGDLTWLEIPSNRTPRRSTRS
ncbi:PadR family transcriptional regulator [Amycolatopsis taiwanensis]|uniref:PadR family transcriptional regulator n=2 Tax=Amycolatopsis taiwanensis TaxID=342230 RepID=A0A9W6QUJ8_9PSEU|nr:PadR family transcriptional regulator [Amycolatopsis taiwanensis]